MTESRLPWRPHYVDEFARHVRGWPLVAQAIYLQLCDHQWSENGLPAEPERLRVLVGGCRTREWSRGWPYCETEFPIDADGMRRNPGLVRLFAEQWKKHQSFVNRGHKGGRPPRRNVVDLSERQR